MTLDEVHVRIKAMVKKIEAHKEESFDHKKAYVWLKNAVLNLNDDMAFLEKTETLFDDDEWDSPDETCQPVQDATGGWFSRPEDNELVGDDDDDW